jgi:signal transduction histidine kinase/PAS domain-containing protein
MPIESVMINNYADKSSQCTREVLVEQILWLIRLRWIAVGALIISALLGRFVFPVLASPMLIYACAGILLGCNIIYFLAATKKSDNPRPRDIILGMVQVEVDLLVLTAVLQFSGGVLNPCFLFYIFHVIIAAIILPQRLSFIVGLTAILLFGFLELNELYGGAFLGYYPLKPFASGGPWRDPVYSLGVFVAFSFTVILAQYLTRMIITRMTAKELEAARNNDVLKAVINAMSEGLIFVTKDENVSICNPAAKLWKQEEASSEQKHSFEDFPRPLAERFGDVVSHELNTEPAERAISFETAGPEKKYIEAKGCPVMGIDGKELGYVIVGQDLTEHKKLETDLRERTEEITAINELLRKSRIEMAQREKMVAIGQMATGIAHEIGNPLASISSVAQYLVRRLKIQEQKEQLLVIQYHISRISNILRRMLSLSRPATGEYKWTDIDSLIKNTLSLINFDKRANSVTIENVASGDLPKVWMNPQHFEQVFLNVFINALDAMNAKPSSEGHRLKITRALKNSMIEIRISDTGIGMTPEVRRRAFDSFFTTKEIGKGTGLGLFITHNLVTEIDGTVELESESGKGTTVIIRIPLKTRRELINRDNREEGFFGRAKAV